MKKKKEFWEKEFDKEFYAYGKNGKRLKYPYVVITRDKHIKKFISKLLETNNEKEK